MSSLRAIPLLNSLLVGSARQVSNSSFVWVRDVRQASSVTNSLPRVAQPSLWHSMVPKFLRTSERSNKSPQALARSKDWNPATFYVWMFLLIGSNAINMIALRNDFVKTSSIADKQIRNLKEVIDRVRAGKKVDVEALLGTGKTKKEIGWAQILDELAHKDRSIENRKKKMVVDETSHKNLMDLQQQQEEDTSRKNSNTIIRREEGHNTLPSKHNTGNESQVSPESPRRGVDFY